MDERTTKEIIAELNHIAELFECTSLRMSALVSAISLLVEVRQYDDVDLNVKATDLLSDLNAVVDNSEFIHTLNNKVKHQNR